MSERKSIPNGMKFLFGGVAGMGATCFVQPFDLLKTRMQIAGKNEFKTSLHCMHSVVTKEGFLALYKGLGAALLRQATYTTTRLGVYTLLREKYAQMHHSEPSFLVLAAMAMIAGAIGAFAGTPAELALIRMSSDGRLPAAERRNYKNVLDALRRITREEGALALCAGSGPTVMRAIVVNMAQLTTYTQSKVLLVDQLRMGEGIGLHFAASMLSGIVTTTASMPVDIVKTRIQNMKVVNGVPEYSGAMDVLTKIVRNEGILALWKGFTPYLYRVGPHTVLTFIILEQLNKFYTQNVLNNKDGGG